MGSRMPRSATLRSSLASPCASDAVSGDKRRTRSDVKRAARSSRKDPCVGGEGGREREGKGGGYFRHKAGTSDNVDFASMNVSGT